MIGKDHHTVRSNLFGRLALLAAMLILAPLAIAATPGRTAYSLKQPEQRTRSAAAPRIWSMSWGTGGLGDFKLLKASNATSEAEEQLFYYDSQVAVSCLERSPNRAHRAAALGCWLHAQSATVSLGNEVYCTPSGTSCTPPVYNLGFGAGRMTYVNASGNNALDYGACFVVPCGVGPVYQVVPSSAFRDSSAASYRTKACSNGHPCRIDADCSDSTTCSSSNTILGAFLGFAATSTSVDVQIQEAL